MYSVRAKYLDTNLLTISRTYNIKPSYFSQGCQYTAVASDHQYVVIHTNFKRFYKLPTIYSPTFKFDLSLRCDCPCHYKFLVRKWAAHNFQNYNLQILRFHSEFSGDFFTNKHSLHAQLHIKHWINRLTHLNNQMLNMLI